MTATDILAAVSESETDWWEGLTWPQAFLGSVIAICILLLLNKHWD